MFIDQAWRAFRLALSFLTIIPVGLGEDETSDAELAASRFAFPVAGAAIGLVLASVSLGLSRWGVAQGAAAFLLVAVGVVLTGALHLDGLADTADGLFLAGTPERRLEAMRDPRVGSFGVISLVLLILGRYSALGALRESERAWALVGSAVMGRALLLVSAGMADYARPEGTGRNFVEASTSLEAAWAALGCVVVGLLTAGGKGAIAAAAALALAWGVTKLARTRLGGVTGDTLGAVLELGELGFLTTLVLVGSTRA